MDNQGRTPLYLAALNGHLQVCKYIVINSRLSDTDLLFPFSNAVTEGHIDVCKFLIVYLVHKNPVIDKKGCTTLHQSAERGKEC